MDLDAPLQANTNGVKIVVLISSDVSYAKIEDRNNNFDGGNDAGYGRFLARLNYTF